MNFKDFDKFKKFLIKNGYVEQLEGYEEEVEGETKEHLQRFSNKVGLEVACYTKGADEASIMINVGDECYMCSNKIADKYKE